MKEGKNLWPFLQCATVRPFQRALEQHLAQSKHTGQITFCQMNVKVRTREEQGRIQAGETPLAKAPR